MKKSKNLEIAELIKAGSLKYYEYLEETGKGVILFDVVGIERIFAEEGKKCLYRLKLDKKLKNVDGMILQVREHNYLSNQVKFLLWDEDKRDLIVQVLGKLAKEELAGLEHFELKDIKVLLDLKYLVERTGAWFRSNAIFFPNSPKQKTPFIPLDNMSNSQKNACEFCLDNAFSYIWGAPGTGKTKYVLSSAVLSLFLSDKKVLVTAPTNNSLEQALSAIINTFDKKGIDRKNIIRIGTPSKSFADRYPEVLEIRGFSHIITTIKKQKDLLEDVVRFKTEQETMKEVVDTLCSKIGKNDSLSVAANEMLKNMQHKFLEKQKLYSEYEDKNIQEIKQDIIELEKQISDASSREANEGLHTYKVVGCTIDGYIGTYLAGQSGSNSSYDHIFLDEAGYCSLAKAATLFAEGIPVTFLGDHFQLPPVCEIDDVLLKNSEYKEVFVWAQSALYIADLLNNGSNTEYNHYLKKISPGFEYMKKTDLTETYRFENNLLEILCKFVYKSDLKSCVDGEGLRIEVLDAPRRSIVDKKRANLDEANAIRDYLRKNHLRLGSIAVLAPYKNQISLLKKNCYHYVGDNVLTVHGSQGREWDTVIFSVCDTTDKYFTDSNNLRSNGKLILNTAISRVRKNLIIVCDENFWSKQSDQLLYEIIKNKNA